MSAGPRSAVTSHTAFRHAGGTSRTWQRVIGRKLYSFTAVTRASGERRYAVRRYTGGDKRLARSWKPAGHWTFPPEPEPENCPDCKARRQRNVEGAIVHARAGSVECPAEPFSEWPAQMLVAVLRERELFRH